MSEDQNDLMPQNEMNHTVDSQNTAVENTSVNKNEQAYTADKITVLEGLEAVRKRPSMYIGDTGVRGLHHLVYEVVDNCIDEAMAGFCDTIYVVLEKDDVVRVEDNGRGIPVDIHPGEGISALELVLTRLQSGIRIPDGHSPRCQGKYFQRTQ